MPPDTQALWRRRTLVLAAFALTFGAAYVWLGTREESAQSNGERPPDEPLTDTERSALVVAVRSGQRTLEHPTLRLSVAYPEGFRLVSSGPPERRPDASAIARKTAAYVHTYELDDEASGARMVLGIFKAKGPRGAELVLPTVATATIGSLKRDAEERGVSYRSVRDDVDKRAGHMATWFEALVDDREYHGVRNVAFARGRRSYVATLTVQAPSAERVASLLDSLVVAP